MCNGRVSILVYRLTMGCGDAWQGWLNVARLVLPVAAADAASVAEAVHKVEALTDGLSLLHLAVRSQSAPLVRPRRLLSHVKTHRHPFAGPSLLSRVDTFRRPFAGPSPFCVPAILALLSPPPRSALYAVAV